MPSHQSAASTLIREVLADPDLAHDDVFRRLLQAGLQDLVDAEAAAVIGAGRYERTPERTNRRNGKRLKTVATTAGEVELAIPKLRTGSFFPSLLHPRRRVDKALYAVICSAWIEGVSTRKAWRPGTRPWAMSPGSPGPRSPGSATGIDEGVKEFLARSLDHTWFPHLFAGRHVPGRAGGAPGGPPGPGGGHRRVGPGPPGDPGTWPRGTPRPPISGRPCPAVPARTGAQGPLPPRPRGRGPGLPATPTPASAPPSGPSCPGPPGSAAAPRFARTITTRAGPGPPPSPRAPWSPRSSPRPRPRPSPPSTSTSSTLRGTPSLQNRPDAEGRRAGPDRVRRLPPRALDQDPAAATPSSASTARSSAEQTWSRSSPTASPHAP